MNQARRIIQLIGNGNFAEGVRLLSEITGVHRTRVYRWTKARDAGGTGGLIPVQHHEVIMDGARRIKRPVEPSDFFQRAPRRRSGRGARVCQ